MKQASSALAMPYEFIVTLRGQKIILDTQLAKLYGVPVKRLNQQVSRNRRRFPVGFIFQLTAKESESLRLQNATSNSKRGGRRYLPYAFTEHGAIMAATVLNSRRAVKMSVFVVRAFVHFRQLVVNNSELAAKLNELESRLKQHDSAIGDLIAAVRELMIPKPASGKRIGFELPAQKPPSVVQKRRLHLLH